MTNKIALTNLVNLENETTAVTAINANNAELTAAVNNSLSLDGTQPNAMGSNLDMNSHRIINLPSPISANEPVSLQYFNTYITTGQGVSGLTGVPVSAAMQPVVDASTTAAAYALISGGLISLTGPTTFFVNSSTGNNSNNGLTSATPFQGINFAVNYILGNVDTSKGAATLQLAAGSYNEEVVCGGPLHGVNNTLFIIGDPVTPANVTWTVGTLQTALFTNNGCFLNVTGIAFRSSGTSSTFLDSFNGSLITFQNCDFGSAPGLQSHILVGNGGTIVANGPYTISGGSGSHILLLNGQFTYVGTSANPVSMPSPCTFSNNFAIVDHGFILCDGTVTFSGSGSGSGSTGSQYSINLTGSIFFNGTTFPGNSAGTTSSGGNFLP